MEQAVDAVPSLKRNGSTRALILRNPEILSCGIEWAVCSIPKLLSRELRRVVPGVYSHSLEVLAIPTCQHAQVDLVSWGTDEDMEKDLLLEKVHPIYIIPLKKTNFIRVFSLLVLLLCTSGLFFNPGKWVLGGFH